jgi:hypothetical protein
VSLASRTYEYGTSLLTGPLCVASAASGGTQLGSGSVFSVSVVNISGNNPVWLGGNSVSFAPVSGFGLILYGGAAVDIRVDRVDDIRVCAETSGNQVSWLGVVR